MLQAKVEPGNINKLQIAPTVQATKSNYSGVHGGSKVPYINYFLKFKNLTKYNQSEQGFRYLFKFNLNILIEVSTKIKSMPNFYWLTKNEIKKLINERSVLNMDTISVLSCFVTKFKSNYSINSKKKINEWINKNDKNFFIKIKTVNLSKLKDWSFSLRKIIHKHNKHFSVIGIKVKTNKREKNHWSQPILKGKNMAFAGFIKTKVNNIDHYLCRYISQAWSKKKWNWMHRQYFRSNYL